MDPKNGASERESEEQYLLDSHTQKREKEKKIE